LFGERINPITNKKEFHNGIDIAIPENTEVCAVADALVKHVGTSETLGNYIIYDIDDLYQVTYGHLKEILVKPNEEIKQKQIIALSGKTGFATGPHLHYSLKYKKKFIDPMNFIDFADDLNS
jgi:murein DD-endopeptidase MepM/ murein hydrolase activator NlpD